jgi:hypothetical protein
MDLSLKYDGGVSGRTQISPVVTIYFGRAKTWCAELHCNEIALRKRVVRAERLQSPYRETESWKPWYSGNLPLSPPACASLPDFTKLYPRDTGQKTPPPSLPPTGKTA